MFAAVHAGRTTAMMIARVISVSGWLSGFDSTSEGVVALIAGIIAVVVWLIRRRRRKATIQ